MSIETTPALGLPYPTAADPVALGAQRIKDLALALDALLPGRWVERYAAADQAVPNAATTQLTLTGPATGPGAAWATGSTFTLPAGRYRATIRVTWASSTAGVRIVWARLAGAIIDSVRTGTAATDLALTWCTRPFTATEGAVFSVDVYQTSGAALAASVLDSGLRSVVHIERLH